MAPLPSSIAATARVLKFGERGVSQLRMTVRDIRELRDTAPFKPFALRLSSGRTMQVITPDHLLFSPRGDLLVLFPPEGGVSVIDPEHVASVDMKAGRSS